LRKCRKRVSGKVFLASIAGEVIFATNNPSLRDEIELELVLD
jgi:hypothetical protein